MLARGGLAQELPQVRARAAEPARHGVALRDQLHDLLVPIGEGRTELGEQAFHPPPRPRSEHLLHEDPFVSRVDGLYHAPHHSLVPFGHALPSSRQGCLHSALPERSLTGGVGWSDCSSSGRCSWWRGCARSGAATSCGDGCASTSLSRGLCSGRWFSRPTVRWPPSNPSPSSG